MIIGFSGLARSGKNEAANALVDKGFHLVAFADKLKEFLWNVNPWMRNAADNTYRPLQEVFELYDGWEGMKDSPYYMCYRQLIQNMGTEAGRNTLGADVWIEALDRNIVPSRNYVIPDIRFSNEENYVRNSDDGLTIRIERPGLGRINGHESESLEFDSQYVIINDGSIEDLHRKVLSIYESHQHDQSL